MTITVDEIKTQISHAGESSTLELKKSTASLTDAAKSLCGFLNAKGGRVIFGITDKRKLVGQEVTDKTKLDISHALRKFEPSANIEVDYVYYQSSKYLIVLTAEPDERSIPYTFDGRPYERGESDKGPMSQSRYQQLLLDKAITPGLWESLPSTLSLDELDHEEIRGTIEMGIKERHFKSSLASQSVEIILTQLKLLQGGQIVNAAAILFGKDTESAYIQSVVRMARFKGLEKGDFIDNKQSFGNAFQLLEAAENFIHRNTAISSIVPPGKMKRDDTPEYPVAAIREALINAICHRDYTSSGGAITLTIYDDRMEIINTGLLPKGISLAELKLSHASHPRNPLITKVFYRRGLIEEMGMGTQKIVQLCAEAGLKEPEFFERAGTFVVKFWSNLNAHTNKKYNVFTDRQTKIIEVIGSEKLAPSEIFNHLHQSIPERTLRRELNTLKGMGALDFEGAQGPARKWYARN